MKFSQDVRLMLDKGPKVSRQYLPPRLSYPENPGRADYSVPPPPQPSGARVNGLSVLNQKWAMITRT